jgi:hypothetical protein
MLWLSIAMVIISSEIVLAYLYVTVIRQPKQLVSNINIDDMQEKIRLLEDQVSQYQSRTGHEEARWISY